MAILASRLYQYQVNNSNALPPIMNGAITNIDAYLNDSGLDTYTLIGYEAFTGSPYDGNESSFSTLPANEMHIFYNSTCNAKQRITPSTSEYSFAIIHSSSDNTAYYCVTNNAE